MLKCPTLFLYGRDSPNRDPAFFEDLVSRHPHVSTVDTIEGGHPPPLMSFGQVAPIVDFIIKATSEKALPPVNMP